METSTPTWKQLWLPVLFALVTGLLLIIAWVSFGGSTPLGAQGYRVAIPVGDASNLVPGSDVQISGVQVGTVTTIERDGSEPMVEIELDSEHAPLTVAATATVRTKTLLGEGYVELATGDEGAEAIPEGGVLAPEQVAGRVQLDEFLATFDEETRAGARRLLGGLADSYGNRERELSNAIARFEPTTASLDDVLTILDTQRGELEGMIAGSADVLGALGERQGALRAAIDAGDRLLDATSSRDTELAATIRALPGFLQQLETTSGTIEGASGDLNEALAAVRKVTPSVVPALTAIDRYAPEFRRFFEDVPRTARVARKGLPAAARTSRAAQPALQAIYPAMRELNPFLALFSANSPELVAVMSNLASSTNGRLLGPGNIELPNAMATVFLGNESLLGYRSRLPSNRLNPYIKPGGLREIERRGHLLSYDCRNTDNPPLVPIIGFGAPPCVEQGPWELLGAEQYFPRLERSDP